MTDISFLTLPHGRYKLAYVAHAPKPLYESTCHVLFLTGFRSDMQGTKALFLEEWAKKTGRGFIRFDYSGHGQSTGSFEELGISDWLNDATEILRQLLPHQPVLVVGSSMGGWLGLLLARRLPDRIEGFIGLATAVDMTGALLWETFDADTQSTLMQTGKICQSCDYDPENPYIITRHLIEDGAQHLLLDQDPIDLELPIRLIHGLNDQDVPWQLSVHLLQTLASEDVTLQLIKDGDHRLSRPQDLAILEDTLNRLIDSIDAVNTASDDFIAGEM